MHALSCCPAQPLCSAVPPTISIICMQVAHQGVKDLCAARECVRVVAIVFAAQCACCLRFESGPCCGK